MFRKVLWGFIMVIFVVQILAIGLNEIVPGEYYNLTDYERLTGKKITKFNEAPMLKEMVEKGLLPSVEERLPKNPVVVTPYEEIGQYGGTWRRVWFGLPDQPNVDKIAVEKLVMFDKTGGVILPNVFEKWEISNDGRTFTFKIREGLKWSDGVPVTTEDVRFWYEDILMNKELTPTIPTWLTAGGKPLKIEIIDKYTFKVIFEAPYPLFLYQLAYQGQAGYVFVVPSHYLKNYHPKYVSLEKLTKMAKDEGYEYWWQLFGARGSNTNAWITNPELPVLYPWKLKKYSDTQLIIERNPYYFKIDPEGNQLPYIDEIVFYRIQDKQMALMKAMAGEVDMQTRHFGTEHFTILLENREKGGYRVLRWIWGVGSIVTFYVNQNVQDPVLREIFQTPKFRYALSLAINREEVASLVFHNLGEPRQASLISGVAFYDPEWEKAFAEYDPERANKLLDEMGLTKRDEEGYRLRPDGKRFELIVEYSVTDTVVDVLEMVKQYWEKLGIKVILKPEERSLYMTRCEAGEPEIGVWSFDRCAAVLSDPGRLLGTVWDGPWAPLYARWYISGGKAGEEPPEGSDIRRIYELWDKVKTSIDEEERNKYFKEIIDIHKKNIFFIGTVGEMQIPVVVKNNFRNVPDGLIFDHPLFSPKNARPEQFFFKTR
jgi:peptide/nickel transport system substrate-binding protein